MTEHTREPWRCVSGTFAVGCAVIGDDNTQITPALPNDANARRIVACVNACIGIPTERLEAGATADDVREAIAWQGSPSVRELRQTLVNISAKLRGEDAQ